MSNQKVPGRYQYDKPAMDIVFLQPSGTCELHIEVSNQAGPAATARRMVNAANFLGVPIVCNLNGIMVRAQPAHCLSSKKSTTWHEVVAQYEQAAKKQAADQAYQRHLEANRPQPMPDFIAADLIGRSTK